MLQGSNERHSQLSDKSSNAVSESHDHEEELVQLEADLQSCFFVPITHYWAHNGGTAPRPGILESGYDSISAETLYDVCYDRNIDTATYNYWPSRRLLKQSGVRTWINYPLSTSPRAEPGPGVPVILREYPRIWTGAAVFSRPERQGLIAFGKEATGGMYSRQWTYMAIVEDEAFRENEDGRFDWIPGRFDLEKIRAAAQECYELDPEQALSPRSKV